MILFLQKTVKLDIIFKITSIYYIILNKNSQILYDFLNKTTYYYMIS